MADFSSRKKRPLGLRQHANPTSALIRTPRTPRRPPASKRLRSASVLQAPQTPLSGRKAPTALRASSLGCVPCTPPRDRFIPPRSAEQAERSFYQLTKSAEERALATPCDCEQRSMQQRFQAALQETLLGEQISENVDPQATMEVDMGGRSGQLSSARVLDFSGRGWEPQPNHFRPALQVIPQQGRPTGMLVSTPSRHISSTPLRVLDAPELVDDYYLNLIHWGRENVLAVALGPSVYLWDAKTCSINHLVQLRGPTDFVTSVNWSPDGKTIAIGCNCSHVRIYDAETLSHTRTFSSHQARVGSLSWNGETSVTSGSRDASILSHDMRIRNHVVARYSGHLQEVCGLTWNSDGFSLASGGNENFLCLWDCRTSGSVTVNPRLVLRQHQAAVKALSWAPFSRHVLASGGGTADRSIKIWNAANGSCQSSVDTGSQVCSIVWSPHSKELCSSHGFSEHQLVLWKFPQMLRIKELKGHTARVLHLAVSPDGSTVISAAADETLRFWEIFGAPTSSPRSGSGHRGPLTRGRLGSLSLR